MAQLGVRAAIAFIVAAGDSRRRGGHLAGLAACIGGIRYRGQQFSLSEARYRFHRSGPDDNHVIAMTHEIGHLFGAQHHYGNCTEGRTRVGSGSCTVMSSFGGLDSNVFGTLEATVVRGYAVKYA